MILKNFPQAPKRAWINQMKVCQRVMFHERLVVCEKIKVRLLLPFLESFVVLSRIPSSQRNIFEQWRSQKIKLRLADNLEEKKTSATSQLKLLMILKLKVFISATSSNCNETCPKYKNLINLTCELTILIVVFAPTSTSYPSVGA